MTMILTQLGGGNLFYFILFIYSVLEGEALEQAVVKLLRTLFPGLVSPHQKITMERITIALTK